jgi:hypothetical protein
MVAAKFPVKDAMGLIDVTARRMAGLHVLSVTAVAK